jgi:ribonuclease P protein component
MKLLRLQGRKTSEYVLRKGRVWRGKTFTVYWLPGPQRRRGEEAGKPGLYVGTFASAKLHKSAVVRNRMRRRVREALRIHVQERTEMPSAQLLLTPRSASLKASFEDIQKEVSTFLSLLPPWPTKK